MCKPYHKIVNICVFLTVTLTYGVDSTPLTEVSRDTVPARQPAYLAPKPADFSRDGDFMRAANERFVQDCARKVRSRLEALDRELTRGGKNVLELMSLYREISRIRDHPASVERWLALAGTGTELREKILRAAADAAESFIREKYLKEAEKLHTQSLASITFTGPGRLALLDRFILSDDFSRKYIDLRKGAPMTVNFGVGVPPVTTVEQHREFAKANKDITTVGVDIYYPAMVVNGPGVEAHFGEKGELLFFSASDREIPFKMKEEFDAISAKMRREGKVMPALIPKGFEVWLMGEKENYGLPGLRFVKGSFDFPIDRPADMITVMNLFYYYPPHLTAAALVEFEKRLADGGILLAGWKRIDSDCGEYIIFRKREGQMMPVELCVSGLTPDNIEAVSRQAQRLQRLAEINAMDFHSDFFGAEVKRDLIGLFSTLSDRFDKNARSIDRLVSELLCRYARLGYTARYDQDFGFLRFQYDHAGNLAADDKRAAGEIISRTGIPEIMQYSCAPEAFLPFFRLRMGERNLPDLRSYAEYAGRSESEMAQIRKAVARSVTLDENVFTITLFFYNYYMWGKKIHDYLQNLIRLKIDADDYFICVKSIGSSTGREAYSMGILIYEGLVEYASARIYKDVQDPDRRRKLAEAWVDRWQVRLEAYDSYMQVLERAVRGVYGEGEMGTIREFNIEKFPSLVRKEGGTLTIDERLRRWLVPIYTELNDPAFERILKETPGDIIMCNRVLGYLKGHAGLRLIDMVQEELASGRYPSFIVADRLFGRDAGGWTAVPDNMLKRSLEEHGNDAEKTARALGMHPADLLIAESKMLIKRAHAGRGGDLAYIARIDAVRALLRAEVQKIDEQLGRMPLHTNGSFGPEAVVEMMTLEAAGTDLERELRQFDRCFPLPDPASRSGNLDEKNISDVAA